jgi:hypothetical protein
VRAPQHRNEIPDQPIERPLSLTNGRPSYSGTANRHDPLSPGRLGFRRQSVIRFAGVVR